MAKYLYFVKWFLDGEGTIILVDKNGNRYEVDDSELADLCAKGEVYNCEVASCKNDEYKFKGKNGYDLSKMRIILRAYSGRHYMDVMTDALEERIAKYTKKIMLSNPTMTRDIANLR